MPGIKFFVIAVLSLFGITAGARPFLLIEPSGSFTAMGATDSLKSNGNFTSNINPGGRVIVGATFGGWRSQIAAGAVYTKIDGNSATDTLSHNSQLLWRASGELGRSLGSRLYLLLDGSYGKQLFITRTSPSSLDIVPVEIPEVSGRLFIKLIKFGRSAFGPEGGAGYLFSGKSALFTIHQGFSFRGGLFLETRLGRLPTQLNLYYLHRSQSTSLTSWITQELGLAITFGLNLFENYR